MYLRLLSNFTNNPLDVWDNQHVDDIGKNMNYRNNECEELDTAKYDFPSDIWIMRPLWETVFKILSILPIFLLGTLANASLIHVITRAKHLQTTTNLLVVNMAIADLGTCLVCPWMFLCTDLFQNYIMGAAGCRLDGFSVHALTLVAVFNLSAVSYDRLSAIVLNSTGKLMGRATYVASCATWISGVALATPLAFFRKYHERQWKNFLETYCAEESAFIYPYWHIFAGLSVWAPLGIMAICYSTILIKLERYEAQALMLKHTVSVHHKGRVTRILALIVLALIICRVPFTALIIQRAQVLQQHRSRRAETMYLLWYISRYLVLVNAAINPVLYGCSSSALRRELALCPATSWLFCKRITSTSPSVNVPQRTKSQRFNCLKPRSCSPYSGVQYQIDRNMVPSISSTIVDQSCKLQIKHCRGGT